MNEQETREAIAARIRAEVEPLLDVEKYDNGYDCCGCSTYWMIVEHCVAIALGKERPEESFYNR